MCLGGFHVCDLVRAEALVADVVNGDVDGGDFLGHFVDVSLGVLVGLVSSGELSESESEAFGVSAVVF